MCVVLTTAQASQLLQLLQRLRVRFFLGGHIKNYKMSELKNIQKENRDKFFCFSFGIVFKIAGYFVLFYIDWKIALGIMLVDRGGELISRSL